MCEHLLLRQLLYWHLPHRRTFWYKPSAQGRGSASHRGVTLYLVSNISHKKSCLFYVVDMGLSSLGSKCLPSRLACLAKALSAANVQPSSPLDEVVTKYLTVSDGLELQRFHLIFFCISSQKFRHWSQFLGTILTQLVIIIVTLVVFDYSVVWDHVIIVFAYVISGLDHVLRTPGVRIIWLCHWPLLNDFDDDVSLFPPL